MWATFETETDPLKHKQEIIDYLNQKGERKLNVSASCMMMMALPEYLSKKFEAHMDDPRKMFDIICDRYNGNTILNT